MIPSLAGIDVAVDGLYDQVGVEAPNYHRLVAESQAGLIVLGYIFVLYVSCAESFGLLKLCYCIERVCNKRPLIYQTLLSSRNC
jgi:hypothetical protein